MVARADADGLQQHSGRPGDDRLKRIWIPDGSNRAVYGGSHGDGRIGEFTQRARGSSNRPGSTTTTVSTLPSRERRHSTSTSPYGAMLHSILEIHNAADAIVASSASAATLGQSLSINLPTGRYYAVVKSYGQYGDVGRYSLSGQRSLRRQCQWAGTRSTTEAPLTGGTWLPMPRTMGRSLQTSRRCSPAGPDNSPTSPAIPRA